MLADKKKMLLQECLEKCSHREYLAWMQFYKQQWKELSLTDYHLLRIAQRAHQALVKKPGEITLQHEMLTLEEIEGKKEETPELSVEEATILSKSRWGMILQKCGVKPKETKAKDR